MDKISAVHFARGLGVPEDQLDDAANEIIANLPPQTYSWAVLFLGGVTALLALGAIVLAALDKPVVDALWSVLGAGIGGLAGIFMAKS